MRKILFVLSMCIFVILTAMHCVAQESPELPENLGSSWKIGYQGKWIVQNTQDSELILEIPSSAIIRYCAGEVVPLAMEYVGDTGIITFEMIADEESETGVRYEIREIQILCY